MSAWSSGAALKLRPESRQGAQGALFEEQPREVRESLQGLPERFQGRALARLKDLRDPTSHYFGARGQLEVETRPRGDGSQLRVGWWRYSDMCGDEHVWEDTGTGGDSPESPERWYAQVAEQPKQDWLF